MKRIMRFFRMLGDAVGLAILLGGLLLATDNLLSPKTEPRLRDRKQPEPGRAKAAERLA